MAANVARPAPDFKSFAALPPLPVCLRARSLFPSDAPAKRALRSWRASRQHRVGVSPAPSGGLLRRLQLETEMSTCAITVAGTMVGRTARGKYDRLDLQWLQERLPGP
jgi:hypothetical protein